MNSMTRKIIAAAEYDKFPLEEWGELLQSVPLEALYGAVGAIHGTGTSGEQKTARRESLTAALNARLVDRQVHTMERLERAATFLMWVSIAVGVVGVLAAVFVPLALRG